MSKYCVRLNRSIKYAHKNKMSIQIPKLNYDLLHTVAKNDAAFANNADLSSQIGRLMWLTYLTNKVLPVLISQIGRIVFRVLYCQEKLLHFPRYLMMLLLSSTTGILIRTPLRSKYAHWFQDFLNDVISTGSHKREKSFMLDMYAARKAYKALEKETSTFVRSSYSFADTINKTDTVSSV